MNFSAKKVTKGTPEIVYISDSDDDNVPIMARGTQHINLSQWATDRTIETHILAPENENFVDENEQCNFARVFQEAENEVGFPEIFLSERIFDQQKGPYNFSQGAEEDLENALDGKLCELEIENTAFDLSTEYNDIMNARKNGSNLLDEDEVLQNELQKMELIDLLVVSEQLAPVVLDNGDPPTDSNTQRRVFDFHTANAIRALRPDLDDVSIQTLTDCFFKAVPQTNTEK